MRRFTTTRRRCLLKESSAAGVIGSWAFYEGGESHAVPSVKARNESRPTVISKFRAAASWWYQLRASCLILLATIIYANFARSPCPSHRMPGISQTLGSTLRRRAFAIFSREFYVIFWDSVTRKDESKGDHYKILIWSFCESHAWLIYTIKFIIILSSESTYMYVSRVTSK